MRRVLVGPGSSHGTHVSTTDPGKSAPAGQNTGNYRGVGAAAGPQSSHAEYSATLDPGKAAPAGQETGNYRRVGAAAGPQSSHAEYSATLDPGKAAPAGQETGNYRRVGAAASRVHRNSRPRKSCPCRTKHWKLQRSRSCCRTTILSR
eukprot:TRINITY_DN33_c0_g1_i3.p1 TRINITY_DN33_c0_g1~~TRINITY_DN33_c0_g1_i3.p1  ORF type:complete len:148 (-),score=13.63 TRINITY_DN33_c0_g1_i3:10-453(-)